MLLALAAVAPAATRPLVRATAIASSGALVLALATAPITLAGEQVALMPEAFGSLTREHITACVSDFLLHGGGYGFSALVVWLALGASAAPRA